VHVKLNQIKCTNHVNEHSLLILFFLSFLATSMPFLIAEPVFHINTCVTNKRMHTDKMCLCCSAYLCGFVCKCVLYYCHRLSTQFQLTNISISILLFTDMFRSLLLSSSSSGCHTRIQIIFFVYCFSLMTPWWWSQKQLKYFGE